MKKSVSYGVLNTSGGFTPLEAYKKIVLKINLLAKIKEYQKNDKPLTGFTLIELVIAIFILSMGIVGIFNAFYMVNILTADSTDRFVAIYLAQEGMEIVRNVRDINWLKMDSFCATNDCTEGNLYSWVDGFNNCSSGCEADYKTGTNNQSAESELRVWLGGGRYLQINTAIGGSNFYGYSTEANSVNTKFKRKIIISNVTDVDGRDDHIIKVRSEVSWDSRSTILGAATPAGTCDEGINCVATEETLYNWYFPNH